MGRAVSNVYGVATERFLKPIFVVGGNPMEGSFDLWAHHDLKSVELSVTLRLADPTQQVFFQDCNFNLVEHSRESRRSDATRMTEGPKGTFSAKRLIQKAEEYGSLKFHVAAVRNTGQVLDPIAKAVGVVVGQSEPRYVHIDEGPERSGNFLRVKWLDFEKHYPSLSRNSHFVVVDAGLPYLALNSQLASWRTVMDSKGTRGAQAKFRDHAYSVIVADVWSVLTTRTLTRLSRLVQQREDCDPSQPDQDPTNDLEWWEQKLLEMWMTRHYRIEVAELWKSRLFDDLKSGGLQQQELTATIQRFVRLGEEFEIIVQISTDDQQPT